MAWNPAKSFYTYYTLYGSVVSCAIFWNFPVLWRAYRLCAYRLYTSWVCGRLGLHCRRVVPACVVTAIRAAFPADHGQYIGFMEASGDDLSMWPWWSGNISTSGGYNSILLSPKELTDFLNDPIVMVLLIMSLNWSTGVTKFCNAWLVH